MTIPKLGLQLALVGLMNACLPAPEPAIDEATVLVDNTSVRLEASSGARTLYRLGAGERVEVLEKQGSWYRVRDREMVEGWMEESTVLRDRTIEAMRGKLAEAADQPVQNTAVARDVVNLRLAPGRDTDVIRRLPRGARLEVLERRTTPRPDSDATDVWLKVRPAEDEIGWVYAQLAEYEIPAPLRSFTEGRTYAAVIPLRTVEDPVTGTATWYLVAERRPGTPGELDYDGIRLFTWNLEQHRYETTLRLGNLRGVYPLERVEEAGALGFRITVLDAAGQPVQREWVMRGTVPREVR